MWIVKIVNYILNFLKCGDWNLVLDPHMDCCNYVRLNNPKARDKVLSFCQELDLVDPWRIQNPERRRYTWRQHDSVKQARLRLFCGFFGVKLQHGFL